MGLSQNAKHHLRIGLANGAIANEIIAALDSVGGTPGTPVVPVAVTFSANAPATYATPTGALVIADGATPTVVELVKYCNELRANIVALQAILHNHNLTT